MGDVDQAEVCGRADVAEQAEIGVERHARHGVDGCEAATVAHRVRLPSEQALHERLPPAALEPLLQACSVQLEPLVAALAAWLAAAPSEEPQAGDGAAPDAQAQQAALQRIERLLADSDSAAEQAWEQDGALLRPLLGVRWSEVDAALRGFDYEQALHVLRQVASASGSRP